ncbi:anti-sigma factor domain-containing protein [Ureibacillus sp. MALMAid1270]|uniref:anti-sigma factor domain-containing protein n=1 Tax=Ureibacillus sp. MALMAid1270 TaxID=3411629 RepID=UPI003BA40063
MHTYKGILCKINKNYMIFMTAEGEFLRGLPLVSNVDIGDEVEFRLLTTSSLSQKKKKSLIVGPVLVAAALLIFFFTALFPNTNSAYAYVQVGEELELGVNEDGKVISVTNLNEEKPINIEELNGLPLKEALLKAVEEITPDYEEISITTKYTNQEQTKAKEDIEKTIETVKNEKPVKSNDSKQKIKKNNNNNSNNNSKKQNNDTTKDNKGKKNENNSSNKQNNSNKNENQSNSNTQNEKGNSNSNNSKEKKNENNSSNKGNGNNGNPNSSNNEKKKNNNGNNGKNDN